MRVVIPCLNYSDFLAVTLPAWRTFLPNCDLRVVTAPDDQATIEVVRSVRFAQLYCTTAWHDSGPLNKAKALDAGFGFLDGGLPRVDEICLSIDADVLPVGALDRHRIEPNVLYGCPRHRVDKPGDLQRENWRAAKIDLPIMETKFRDGRIIPPAMQGYFQCWRYRSGDSFGSFPSAAAYDLAFAKKFSKCDVLENIRMLHLGQNCKNWRGRKTPKWEATKHEGAANA